MIKWDITLCLLLSWTIVCLCLIKGIKSSGKVVYFSATFPCLLLITLMIYGLLQDGAIDGVKRLFIPQKWSGKGSIQDPQVWRKAAEQMFFSLSISWGGLFMFGSYNKFKHKVHITATVISSLDFLTSIIASVLVFAILGAQSKETGIDLDKLVEGGQGLAFIAYPDALSKLQRFKPVCTVLLCSACFLLSLPCVSESGPYVFQIMDDYGGGMSVLWIAVFEMVCICWIY